MIKTAFALLLLSPCPLALLLLVPTSTWKPMQVGLDLTIMATTDFHDAHEGALGEDVVPTTSKQVPSWSS